MKLVLRKLWAGLKFIFLFARGPFGDPSGVIAFVGGMFTAMACLFARGPELRRRRNILGLTALAAFAFWGWRFRDEQSGYTTELVSLDNQGAHLVGTLYRPDRVGKVPGIVLVHGSGPLPRWTYSAFGAHFAKAGYATLIYDKRGIGDSTGHFEGGVRDICPDKLNLLASDASAAISFLARRPEVRGDAVGLFGASQAGWIIPRAAALNDHAAFMLLIAGPTDTAQAIVRLERLRLGPPNGDSMWIQSFRAFSEGGRDVPDGYTPDRAFALAQTKSVDFPCADFDPMIDLRALNIPGMWLLGDKDWIVPAGTTSRNLESLRKAGKPYQFRVIPGAGHTMFGGPKGLVLETMDTWLARVTAVKPVDASR
jgi:uncharacterized protein